MNKNTDNTAMTTEEKRAKTVESNRAARIAERGYSLPLCLQCIVTGKTIRLTSPAYIEKVIAKYGSLEKLQTTYLSREGKRLQAEKAKA